MSDPKTFEGQWRQQRAELTEQQLRQRPGRLTGTGQEQLDFNDAIEFGAHWGVNALNQPPGPDTFWAVTTLPHGDGARYMQIAYRPNAPTLPPLYRWGAPGVAWSAWAGQAPTYGTRPLGYAYGTMAFDPGTATSIVPIPGSPQITDGGMTWNGATHSVVNDRYAFVVPEDGWYEIDASTQWVPGAAGLGSSVMLTQLTVNGAAVGPSSIREWPASSNDTALQPHAFLGLSAGARVQVRAARSGGLTDARIANAYLQVKRLR